MKKRLTVHLINAPKKRVEYTNALGETKHKEVITNTVAIEVDSEADVALELKKLTDNGFEIKEKKGYYLSNITK